MEWHEDNRFWETWEPYLFPDDRLKNAASEAEQVIRLLAIAPGRLSSTSAAGLDVTAWNLRAADFASPASIAPAHTCGGLVPGVSPRILSLSSSSAMCALSVCAEASIVPLNMFTSFGYFEAEKDDLQVLRNAWNALKVGGRMLIEGKEVMARDFRECQWWWHDRSIGLQERKVSDGWDRMETTWILIRNGRVAWQSTVSSRIYSAAEFRHLLEKAGFASATIYGNLAGAPYDEHAAGAGRPGHQVEDGIWSRIPKKCPIALDSFLGAASLIAELPKIEQCEPAGQRTQASSPAHVRNSYAHYSKPSANVAQEGCKGLNFVTVRR